MRKKWMSTARVDGSEDGTWGAEYASLRPQWKDRRGRRHVNSLPSSRGYPHPKRGLFRVLSEFGEPYAIEQCTLLDRLRFLKIE